VQVKRQEPGQGEPMQNDRPIDDPHIQLVLKEFGALCAYYDLAGTCAVIGPHEWAYYYGLPTTWNGMVSDASTPLGFRIRIKEGDLGRERAQELAEGTAHVFATLQDFGKQTMTWGKDLLQVMRRAGMQILHTPFGGKALARIRSMDRPQH